MVETSKYQTQQGYSNWQEERRALENKWGKQGQQLYPENQRLVDSILEFSKNYKLKHIPSALSMCVYVDVIFKTKKINPYVDKFVIGKPFGSQSYYITWRDLDYINDISKYHTILKHTEIDFVDFSGESLGNTLGISIGIALTTSKLVWVNLSDSALQMGSELEAIQYIGQKQYNNIFVTIDYNNKQVTGNINEIIDIAPIKEMMKSYGWDVHQVDGHDRKAIEDNLKKLKHTKPTAVFYKTIKGYGCNDMILNPRKWHYKSL